MNLKERAIYHLPNGRELIACLTSDQRIVLFDVSASGSGVYELNSDGRLLVDGQLTAWQIDDLLETRRIADPGMTSRLAESSIAPRETMNEQGS